MTVRLLVELALQYAVGWQTITVASNLKKILTAGQECGTLVVYPRQEESNR